MQGFSSNFTKSNGGFVYEQALLTIVNHFFQMPSKELTDACNKLPRDLFGVPFCQLIRWFASPMDRAKPGLLSKLFSLSKKG